MKITKRYIPYQEGTEGYSIYDNEAKVIFTWGGFKPLENIAKECKRLNNIDDKTKRLKIFNEKF